jgi:hypothetical protein
MGTSARFPLKTIRLLMIWESCYYQVIILPSTCLILSNIAKKYNRDSLSLLLFQDFKIFKSSFARDDGPRASHSIMFVAELPPPKLSKVLYLMLTHQE